MEQYGPTLPVSQQLHASKYRGKGEDFYGGVARIAHALKDSEEHRKELKQVLLDMRFLPAGRVQSAVGSPHLTTAFNCFVMGEIEDSSTGIMDTFAKAFMTMRQGGGVGYDFSTIRPNGANIATLGSPASGPVSFMDIGDAVCGAVSSAGNRRGAQMAVLRVDHPDIEEFLTCKQEQGRLTRFNISVGITDEFMRCLKEGEPFALRWEGKIVDWVNPTHLWDTIMRSTWDWAEPGILFVDRINKMNNLWYCETISATNPCGEQPLPPWGACLLGSFNLVKYVVDGKFQWKQFKADIPVIVRAIDNVIDETIYPLPMQEEEAKSKRRMGLGITGVANALECLGYKYGTDEYIYMQDRVLSTLQRHAYLASADLAEEKGSFPLYDEEKYLQGNFIKSLPNDVRKAIRKKGIRNSHLLSIAPTGTISLCADNVSSGIEPVFTYEYDRTIQTEAGPVVETVSDYAYREWGVKGVTADQVTAKQHIAVQAAAQKYVDSAVSKTCNIGDEVTWDEFQQVYLDAYEMGAKGCTTFRAAGKRYGILNAKPVEATGEACFIDPVTGDKECG